MANQQNENRLDSRAIDKGIATLIPPLVAVEDSSRSVSKAISIANGRIG